MTHKCARKVVIIDDIKSEIIEQAIFILKTDIKKEQWKMSVKGDFIIKEAHQIIDNYIKQVDRTSESSNEIKSVIKKHKKRKIARLGLSLLVIASTIAAGTLIMKLINMLGV